MGQIISGPLSILNLSARYIEKNWSQRLENWSADRG